MNTFRSFPVSVFVLALLGLFLLTPATARADDFGVRIGTYDGELLAGFEILGQLGTTGRWFYNPNLEWVFVDNGELFSLNADFHYDLATNEPFDVWIGGGPALLVRDPDRGEGDTEVALNLLAGIGFKTQGRMRPYIQGKVVTADDTEASLAFGLRF